MKPKFSHRNTTMQYQSARRLAASVLLLTVCAGTAQADDNAAFQTLVSKAWAQKLRDDPLFATYAGENKYNHLVTDESLLAVEQRHKARLELNAAANAIDRSKLPRQQQINYDIFRRLLDDEIAAYKFKTHLIPITNRWGFHVSFPEIRRQMPFKNKQDYQNYIQRLRGFRKYAQQHIERLREGVKQGYVLPAVVLEGFTGSITAHIVTDPSRSLFAEPLTRLQAAGIPASQHEAIRRNCQAAIVEDVVPGYQDFLQFMKNEYIPAARGSTGASALPDGRAFYRHQVKHFTTLDLSPAEVHQTGLREVKRIRAEMAQVAKDAEFDGDLNAFIKHLRTAPEFYPETAAQLMKEVAYTLKKMDGQLPKLFKTLPRTPYGIRKIPDYIAPKTTSAYYSTPPGDGSRAGFYYVNTFNLKSRPLFEVEALSLHEAVPGHHLQLALQQEIKSLPEFRRFASFTAFVEGWALYSERLGLETGFYQTPYSNFGRLSFEMWRACRLVVDTGLHYFGWSRSKAIEYMTSNTALSVHNITMEVDRYIAWPGQALGYKIGELKIRELRAAAEEQLGGKFDIREFHDVVLLSGSVPLPVLEENVNAFIKHSTAPAK